MPLGEEGIAVHGVHCSSNSHYYLCELNVNTFLELNSL